jgi:carbonic anhydrase
MIKINSLLSKNFMKTNNKFITHTTKLNFIFNFNSNINFSIFQKQVAKKLFYSHKVNKRCFSNTNKCIIEDNINTNENTIDEVKNTEKELSEIKEIFSSLLQNPCSSIKPANEYKGGIYKIENSKENTNANTKEHDCNDSTYLYDRLIKGNELYVSEKTFSNPNYFKDMAKTQTPKFLLIGCSDSRVPPNELTKSHPGEIFIHRNIANQVNLSDLNCMSVIQFAVEYLKIDNIIVMGHTKCGGIVAANNKAYLGLIDQWLISIKDIAINRKDEFEDCKTEDEFVSKLTEVNVKMQCINVCKTPFVQQAWNEGRNLHVHGWILDIETGLIKDLSISNKDWNDVKNIYNFVF